MGRGHIVEMTGKRFGRWLVIERDMCKSPLARWICKCDCGVVRSVLGTYLRSGTSASCGCYAKDYQRERIAREGWADKVRTGATLHVVEKDGKKMTLREWSKEIGISLSVLVGRWNRGWPDERLLEPTPNQLLKKFKYVDPQF